MSSLITPGDFITQGTVIDNVPWSLDPAPLGIVLSNPCDLEWGKASFILIASLISAKDTIKLSTEFKDRTLAADEKFELSKTKWDRLNDMIESLIHNKDITRYFFINPKDIMSAPPLFIDFQNLITVPSQGIDNLSIIGQLPSPHREKMIMHFSSYISRIGVDRINKEKTKSLVDEITSPFKLKTT